MSSNQRVVYADELEEYLLDEMTDDVEYFKTKYIREDLDMNNTQIGMGLGILREREDGPLNVERWSRQTARWKVEKNNG